MSALVAGPPPPPSYECVIPMLHPAFLLRSAEGEGGAGAFEETFEADFRRLVQRRGRDPSWEEEVIWERDAAGRLRNLFPTFEEVVEFCRSGAGQTIAVDVETSGEHPMSSKLLCVGMAREDGRAICVPFLNPPGVLYWTEPDHIRVVQLLADFFAGRLGKPPRLVFHNGAFDSVVLHVFGMGVWNTWAEDTMQAWHVLDSELPMGLDYVASRFTEINYYKDAVKGDVRWLDLDPVVLRSYNLRDVLCTIRALPHLISGLEKAGESQLNLYDEEVWLASEMARATIRGIFVDQSRKYVLSRKLSAQASENLAILRHIAGAHEFKPGSPAHLKWVLFEKLKFPIVKYTDKGNPSTDKDAMVLLALHAQSAEQIHFLQALVSWRKAAKLKSTFVGEWVGPEWEGAMYPTLDVYDQPVFEKVGSERGPQKFEWRATRIPSGGEWVGGIPILSDGRAHPSWKLLTKTGRFASSPNAQNWTLAIKKMFCAPPGRALVGADLNQAELRFIAYLANDPDLLFMYRVGINVHTANASLLFRIRCPNPKDTNEATERYLSEAIPRMLGLRYEDFPLAKASQWKGQRTLAKNFVFGDNYGAEAQTLYEVIRAKRDPDTDKLLFPGIQLDEIEAAKIIWEQAHSAIPRWWKDITRHITGQRYYECPVSGRRRYFKGGFKRNEMLNNPIQKGVGSHMNKATKRVALRLPAGAGINMQVHDMLGAECDLREGEDVAEIMREELSRSFPLPGFPEAVLPPDAPAIGRYVDEI